MSAHDRAFGESLSGRMRRFSRSGSWCRRGIRKAGCTGSSAPGLCGCGRRCRRPSRGRGRTSRRIRLLGERDAAEMGADADQHLPLVVPRLNARSRRRVGQAGELDVLSLFDLFLGAVIDVDRLAAPEHLDHLPHLRSGDIDLDRRAGGDRRRIRISSAKPTGPASQRPRWRRPRRWRRKESRGAYAPPKTWSSRRHLSRSCRVPPALKAVDANRRAAADRPRQPGKGRTARAAAFYWHPWQRVQARYHAIAQVLPKCRTVPAQPLV